MTAPNIPVIILGRDDWLIFGRTTDGRLVFTVIETDIHWPDAPHHGEAEYGSDEWRADNAFMQKYVSGHRADYDWRECDHDTDGRRLDWPAEQDLVFARKAAANYLPPEEWEEDRAEKVTAPVREAHIAEILSGPLLVEGQPHETPQGQPCKRGSSRIGAMVDIGGNEVMLVMAPDTAGDLIGQLALGLACLAIPPPE